MNIAFVTGATGLLGNHIVRQLTQQGIKVRALVRSKQKADLQLGGLPHVTLVTGDMIDVDGFAHHLAGCDVLFHTAAYFRESYQGGQHWEKLHAINVEGTTNLLEAAYTQGIRRMIHISSIAVLHGPRHALIHEEMRRDADTTRDDYYRSKILSDERADAFVAAHHDVHLSFVLPGWMHGPGDYGPTSAGQFTLDYIQGKLPAIPPGSISFVDARDVAHAALTAVTRGERGARYLAAGHPMNMAEVTACYERVTNIPAPTRTLPKWLMLMIAYLYEGYGRITGKPVLISVAAVRMMIDEEERHRFDHTKSLEALGLEFRPPEDTLRDEIAWMREVSLLT